MREHAAAAATAAGYIPYTHRARLESRDLWVNAGTPGPFLTPRVFERGRKIDAGKKKRERVIPAGHIYVYEHAPVLPHFRRAWIRDDGRVC